MRVCVGVCGGFWSPGIQNMHANTVFGDPVKQTLPQHCSLDVYTCTGAQQRAESLHIAQHDRQLGSVWEFSSLHTHTAGYSWFGLFQQKEWVLSQMDAHLTGLIKITTNTHTWTGVCGIHLCP